MSPPIRIAIHGAAGRMGAGLLALLREDPRFALVAALVAPGSEREGMPVHAPALAGEPHYAAQLGSMPVDVLVDFTGAAGFARAVHLCRTRGIALLSGSTGLGADDWAALDEASKHIAVLHAANFSLGIAVLTRLLRTAAAALPQWDIEICEAHHAHKQDAPSGTALALGAVAAAARGHVPDALMQPARHGHSGARVPGSIGFAVMRGGDVVGEHSAWLLGAGERIELSHRASDRVIFARGALEAAHWLAGRAPGRYTLEQVLDADRRSAV